MIIENLNKEIENRFNEAHLGKNLDSWSYKVFGKKIDEMSKEEKERVISYIIIKNENISFRGLVKDLASKLDRDYNTSFRSALYNMFYENKKYNATKEDRTDLLHKLVFLIKVENNIDLLKEKFLNKKNEIFKETKEEKKELNNELYIIPEKTKIHYTKKVKKEDIIVYKEKLSKLEIYKGEINFEISKDFIEAVKYFQRNNGLVEDGRIGEKSLKIIDSELLKTRNKKITEDFKKDDITDKKEIKISNNNSVEIIGEIIDSKRDIEKEAEDILGLSEMIKYRDKKSEKENKILIKILENYLKEENINEEINSVCKKELGQEYIGKYENSGNIYNQFDQNKRLFTQLYLSKNKFDLRDYIEYLGMNYSEKTIDYLGKKIIGKNFKGSDIEKEKLLREMVYLYEFTNSRELEKVINGNTKSEEEKTIEAQEKIIKLKENFIKNNNGQLAPPPPLIKIPISVNKNESNGKYCPEESSQTIKSTGKIPGKCTIAVRNTLDKNLDVDKFTQGYEAPRGAARDILKNREKVGEILKLTKEEAKKYMLGEFYKGEANVFEIFVKTKKRHIAVAFIGNDHQIYILDPYYNKGTTRPIPIDEYSAFRMHKHIYISTKQDLISNKKGLATIAMK